MEKWNEGFIVPVKKKRKENNVKDYREVTLLSTLYKVYAMMLRDRLEKEIKGKKLVPQNQASFRKETGTSIIFMHYIIWSISS